MVAGSLFPPISPVVLSSFLLRPKLLLLLQEPPPLPSLRHLSRSIDTHTLTFSSS